MWAEAAMNPGSVPGTCASPMWHENPYLKEPINHQGHMAPGRTRAGALKKGREHRWAQEPRTRGASGSHRPASPVPVSSRQAAHATCTSLCGCHWDTGFLPTAVWGRPQGGHAKKGVGPPPPGPQGDSPASRRALTLGSGFLASPGPRPPPPCWPPSLACYPFSVPEDRAVTCGALIWLGPLRSWQSHRLPSLSHPATQLPRGPATRGSPRCLSSGTGQARRGHQGI